VAAWLAEADADLYRRRAERRTPRPRRAAEAPVLVSVV
jgi:hypothetical protein